METKNRVISIRLVYIIGIIAIIVTIVNVIPQLASGNEVATIEQEQKVINEIEIADENISKLNTTSRGNDEERKSLNNDEENTKEIKTAEENNEQIVQKTEESNKEEESSKKITIEDVKISIDMDLTERTGLTKKDFIKLTKGIKYDTSGFFKENAEIIYDLCEEYSINEIFFCGLISAESGWNIASNHRRTYNYISIMNKGKLIQFNSVEDGLRAGAKLLHNNYLTKGGAFYNGKTLKGVQKCFCPSDTWVKLVYGRMRQTLE